MDFSLSFLDDFVSDALEAGGQPYKLVGFRQAASVTTSKGRLSYEQGLSWIFILKVYMHKTVVSPVLLIIIFELPHKHFNAMNAFVY